MRRWGEWVLSSVQTSRAQPRAEECQIRTVGVVCSSQPSSHLECQKIFSVWLRVSAATAEKKSMAPSQAGVYQSGGPEPCHIWVAVRTNRTFSDRSHDKWAGERHHRLRHVSVQARRMRAERP